MDEKSFMHEGAFVRGVSAEDSAEDEPLLKSTQEKHES